MTGETPIWYKDEIEQFIWSLPDELTPQQYDQLNDMLRYCLENIDNTPDALFNSLFLKAIRDHYYPQAGDYEHIYLQRYEIPQIMLFDLLINKLPFVVSGHAIVNATIANWLSDVSSAVLIDVGVGRGIQSVRLLKELQGSSIKELTIIGIEPFADAINYAKDAIAEAAKETSFTVNFIPIVSLVEQLTADDLKRVLPSGYDKLIINASLAIHHIQTVAQRRRFFSLIGTLHPDGVILTEPCSDHMNGDWQQRVRNAYDHYGAVFSMIDTLDIPVQEKNGLKVFFGREIDDVVGNPEDKRYERHERGENWIGYLKEIGMKPEHNVIIPPALNFENVDFHLDAAGFLTMRHRDTDVLSVIAAVKA